jgi:hypothetical protein
MLSITGGGHSELLPPKCVSKIYMSALRQDFMGIKALVTAPATGCFGPDGASIVE